MFLKKVDQELSLIIWSSAAKHQGGISIGGGGGNPSQANPGNIFRFRRKRNWKTGINWRTGLTEGNFRPTLYKFYRHNKKASEAVVFYGPSARIWIFYPSNFSQVWIQVKKMVHQQRRFIFFSKELWIRWLVRLAQQECISWCLRKQFHPKSPNSIQEESNQNIWNKFCKYSGIYRTIRKKDLNNYNTRSKPPQI